MKVVQKAPARAGMVERTVLRQGPGTSAAVRDTLAEEVPVSFVYDGVPYAVMLASPCDLEDFAYGFSRSEGLIAASCEVRSLSVRHLVSGIELNLSLAASRIGRERAASRALPSPSSCGLCGTRELQDAIRWPHPVGNTLRISTRAIADALANLRVQQVLYEATGATHAAGWHAPDGTLKLIREDIGRHNALDKLIGAMLADSCCPQNGFLVVTSRASYELVQKAASIGVEMMVAVSAPTALAVRMADSANMTLVGFARAGQHTVYTHPGRLDNHSTEHATRVETAG